VTRTSQPVADESREALQRLIDEQAALRRVAMLAAEDVRPEEIFAAVSNEVGRLVGTDSATVIRYDDDGEGISYVGSASKVSGAFPLGVHWKFQDGMASFEVYRTGRSARSGAHLSTVEGPIGDTHRRMGIISAVASPIVVDGQLWGAMAVHGQEPLPADTEERVEKFTELVATAIANAESRAALTRLAEEQAALRRVATLVARGVRASEIFAAVSDEVGRLVGTDSATVVKFDEDDDGPGIVFVGVASKMSGAFPLGAHWKFVDGMSSAEVYRTGRPARSDQQDWSEVEGPVGETHDRLGIVSAVASPIVVERRLWGAIAVQSQGRLPKDTEERLEKFTSLVATAIANAESRDDLARLAEEQAALRRVATLAAREASQAEVFTAIAEGIAQLFGTADVGMLRYEGELSQVVLASSGTFKDIFPSGSRQPLGGDNASSRVFRTGRPARIDDYGTSTGAIGDAVRSAGVRSVVATPIVVEGRLWGAMVTGTSGDEPLPPETESRVGQFTELMATTIANSESHAKANRLTEEQTALRRVATLVAQAVRPAEIFSAVSEEVGRLFGSTLASVGRFEPDGPSLAVVGVAHAPGVTVGSRYELDDAMAVTHVYRSGRSARVDDVDWSEVRESTDDPVRRLGIISSVASPIVVGGRPWGAMCVGATERLPLDAEDRLEKFTDLVATAIANADARAEVERLAEEQAALRRVAMLVAEGASPTAVFDAVAGEMDGLLDADGVTVSRYEPDEEVTVVAHHGSNASRVPPGTRMRPEAASVTATVRRTERPARMEHYEGSHGAIAQLVHTLGVHTAVGAPIVVEGRLWGIVIATWKGDESPLADTEERMAQFAQLLDTAIANADSRDQLIASRARLMTEGDAARRRVVRDLHDGAQQRLVHTILTLKLAQRAFQDGDGKAQSLVGEALEHAERSNAELRELAHGILPAVLSRGLRAGVDAFAARLDLPVRVDVAADRFPADVEASVYFIVAEALTNVVKHAEAERADVRVSVDDDVLCVEIRDDGSGGADPDGHGLVGLADRATALGGRLEVESPAAGGTLVAAAIPLPG
jgi:GAF domain-containing protein